MGGIDPAEFGQVVAGLDLQPARQRGGRDKRFLQFNRVFQQDDVRLAGEIRIDHAGEGQFRLLQREAAPLGIVPAALELLDPFVVLGGAAGGQQHVHGCIQQPQRARRLGRRGFQTRQTLLQVR